MGKTDALETFFPPFEQNLEGHPFRKTGLVGALGCEMTSFDSQYIVKSPLLHDSMRSIVVDWCIESRFTNEITIQGPLCFCYCSIITQYEQYCAHRGNRKLGCFDLRCSSRTPFLSQQSLELQTPPTRWLILLYFQGLHGLQ